MIVERSALVAILRAEPDAQDYLVAIENATVRRLSAASYVEASIVIDASRSPISSRKVDEFCREAQLIIEPVTEAQARIAREAYRDVGRGSGHLAQLDFGDCFAYALAKDLGEPLLFKGSDFSHTDVRAALQ